MHVIPTGQRDCRGRHEGGTQDRWHTGPQSVPMPLLTPADESMINARMKPQHVSGSAAMPVGASTEQGKGRPNLLVICTDQQHSGMMSCSGNEFLKTPAIDKLAADGVRFSRAYCTNPVCVPSRGSLFTGVMPSQLNMCDNSDVYSVVSPTILSSGAGCILGSAGYEVAYAGKQHLPRCLPISELGFTNILTRNDRDECVVKSADFIRKVHDRPWFLVTSLVNPHDICYAAIKAHPVSVADIALLRSSPVELATLDGAMTRPAGVDDNTFWRELCPPTPVNHLPLTDEPEAIGRYLRKRPFMEWVRRHWSCRDWRMYRWAYHRLTEIVDRQIGHLLSALRDSRQYESTIVIFTSDHGDNDAARKMEHKTLPYDESARVPLIISNPAFAAAGTVSDQLVSNGLDLLPTLCDYAGIAAPSHLRGRSLRPLVDRVPGIRWRATLVVESEICRMIRDERYKYIVFSEGANRFQLFDLEADPYEMVNRVYVPALAEVQHRLHRELFGQIVDIHDRFGKEYVAADDARSLQMDIT